MGYGAIRIAKTLAKYFTGLNLADLLITIQQRLGEVLLGRGERRTFAVPFQLP